MLTLNLSEAALFLRMSPRALREKARKGQVKGAKPAKAWVFLEADLVRYLDSLYIRQRQAPLSGSELEVESWESTNAVKCGGSGLQPRTASLYASLLGLPINGLRSNSTTD